MKNSTQKGRISWYSNFMRAYYELLNTNSANASFWTKSEEATLDRIFTLTSPHKEQALVDFFLRSSQARGRREERTATHAAAH